MEDKSNRTLNGIYLDILHAFTMLEENVLRIYRGAKFMLVIKVSILIPRYNIVDLRIMFFFCSLM